MSRSLGWIAFSVAFLSSEPKAFAMSRVSSTKEIPACSQGKMRSHRSLSSSCTFGTRRVTLAMFPPGKSPRCHAFHKITQHDSKPTFPESSDLISEVGAGNEGDSATRFGALLRRHSIAVPSTFHLATPTFYGSSGRSRTDFVATLPSVQFSRIFVNFSARRRLQLIFSTGPRDHMPLTLELVTDGMRHCPDHTRGR